MINFSSIQLRSFSILNISVSFYWVLFFFGLFIIHKLVTTSFRTDNFPIYDKATEKFIDYPKAVNKIVIWSALGWQLGGRIGWILLHFNKEAFKNNPLWIFHVMSEGTNLRCAILGVLIATGFVARSLNLSIFKLLDIQSFITPTFIFLMHLSRFFSEPIPGAVTHTSFGVVFPGYGDFPRHPIRLYQALAEGLVLQIFLVLNKKQFSQKGRMTCLFLLGYIVLGEFTALFRDTIVYPDVMIGPVSFRHMVEIILIFAVIFIVTKRKIKPILHGT